MGKTYDRVTYQAGQDLHHCLICRHHGWDLRVLVRRNAYIEQSYVRCEVWCRGQGWKELLQHPVHIYPGLEQLTSLSPVPDALKVFTSVEARVLEIARDFFDNDDDWEDDE